MKYIISIILVFIFFAVWPFFWAFEPWTLLEQGISRPQIWIPIFIDMFLLIVFTIIAIDLGLWPWKLTNKQWKCCLEDALS